MMKIFSLARVDVSLALTYPLLFLLCFYWYQSLPEAILAAFAITLSVLIHEFGHALACKRYDLSPSIVIHFLGGFCYHQPSGSDKREAIVVLAGPLLQIFAGVVALGALLGFGLATYDVQNVLLRGSADVLQTFGVTFAIFSLVWGLINLLAPVWPLDGGKLFALILRRFTTEERAARVTLFISMGVLVLVGVLSLLSMRLLLLFIVASAFMQNLRAYQTQDTLFAHSSGRRATRRMSEFGEELFESARENFDEGDYREAARLCHQLRASGEPLSEKRLDEIWTILGLATMQEGDCEEALEWLKRAPKTKEIKAAIARCEGDTRGEGAGPSW